MSKIYQLEDIHNHGIDVENRIVYVNSESEYEGEESGVDYKMARTFMRNMDYLNTISNKLIHVKMMNWGGDWNYGMAMYDVIANSKSQVNCTSYAHARSMSSIIPQAAKVRYISQHADFMVHYGTYGDGGDFRQVINGAKFSQKSIDVMIGIYAGRCVNGEYFYNKGMDYQKTFNFIKKQIEKLTDWWMTAEEAVYYGFMDKVV
jgi:ATP-dependent protease ClpP protease subunit